MHRNSGVWRIADILSAISLFMPSLIVLLVPRTAGVWFGLEFDPQAEGSGHRVEIVFDGSCD